MESQNNILFIFFLIKIKIVSTKKKSLLEWYILDKYLYIYNYIYIINFVS